LAVKGVLDYPVDQVLRLAEMACQLRVEAVVLLASFIVQLVNCFWSQEEEDKAVIHLNLLSVLEEGVDKMEKMDCLKGRQLQWEEAHLERMEAEEARVPVFPQAVPNRMVMAGMEVAAM